MSDGQKVEEAIKVLACLTGRGIVFTSYAMKGVTPDGSTIDITYDVRDDDRFS